MKNTIIILVLGLSWGQGQAASFDCNRAVTKVEKLICKDKVISEIDTELSVIYDKLLGESDEKDKLLLLKEQKHWLKFNRNPCVSASCIAVAYRSRITALHYFFEPKLPLYERESDKESPMKSILIKEKFETDNPFCNQILTDLKQMNGIEFINPVAQASSFENPVFDKLKQHCGNKPPLHFSYGCTSSDLDYLKTDDDAIWECELNFGIHPYKLYKLPLQGTSYKNGYYLSYRGPAHTTVSDSGIPTLNDGIQVIGLDINTCERIGVGERFDYFNANSRMKSSDMYSGIIKYQEHYYYISISKQYGMGIYKYQYAWQLNINEFGQQKHSPILYSSTCSIQSITRDDKE
jgi:uncharacterized protein